MRGTSGCFVPGASGRRPRLATARPRGGANGAGARRAAARSPQRRRRVHVRRPFTPLHLPARRRREPFLRGDDAGRPAGADPLPHVARPTRRRRPRPDRRRPLSAPVPRTRPARGQSAHLHDAVTPSGHVVSSSSPGRDGCPSSRSRCRRPLRGSCDYASATAPCTSRIGMGDFAFRGVAVRDAGPLAVKLVGVFEVRNLREPYWFGEETCRRRTSSRRKTSRRRASTRTP